MFKHEIVDHGACNSQYFQGCGVCYTEFSDVVTGAGGSARQAFDDALDQFYEMATRDGRFTADEIRTLDIVDMEKEGHALSDKDRHDECWRDFKSEYKSKACWLGPSWRSLGSYATRPHWWKGRHATCVLCDERIGSPHGYIYLGDVWCEAVYRYEAPEDEEDDT